MAPTMYPVLDRLTAILAHQRTKGGGNGDIDSQTAWDYGWRISPITNQKEWHNGVDLPEASGTPIHAPWDGVVHVWQDKLNGNGMKISHPTVPGIKETGYAHLSAYGDVSDGGSVKAGDVVGYVGTTGASTGPHLHFVVRTTDSRNIGGADRQDTDPLPFLDEASSASVAVGTATGIGITGGILVGALLLFLYLRRSS